MATVYALLAAIDHYPNPAHALAGCVNDLKEMKTYLEAFCQTHELQLKLRTLLNKEVTRYKLIEELENLSTAKDGDHCLFFYAGHGSRCKTPEAFWHLEPDRMNESLVCWDSRLPDGRDLFDKELSYLIWKVTHGKEVNFVAITDCCHSGSNMRLETVNERRANKVDTAVAAEDYYGFEFYEKTGREQYNPPRGRYIHLAAAQSHETAKEIRVGENYRGVFSFLLLDTLKGTRHPLPYHELINRVRFRIKNLLPDQYPILETSNIEDRTLNFLTKDRVDHAAPFLVSHSETKGWIVNAGAFNGLKSDFGEFPYRFEVGTQAAEIEVKEVYADHSTIQGMDRADPRKIYQAQLIYDRISRLPLAFAPDSDPAGVQMVESILKRNPSASIQFIKDADQARYLMHAKADSYFLTTGFDERPLFKRVLTFSEASAETFLAGAEKVAAWVQLQELKHPASKLALRSVDLCLYQVEEVGDRADDAIAKRVDWREALLFSYDVDKNSIGYPGFKFLLRNTSPYALWVSVLYMGIDFSINNLLMPLQQLKPREEAWCSYILEGHTNRNIPIKLHETFHGWGLTKATNYLKVIISTGEFDSDIFNQEGLKLQDYRRSDRTLAEVVTPPADEWLTRTIPIPIFHPLALQPISDQDPFYFFGHALRAPAGFNALVRPAAFVTAVEAIDNIRDMEAESSFLRPIELGAPEARPQLSVLQFVDCVGARKIDRQRPLQLSFGKEMPDPLQVRPYGFSPQTNDFFKLDCHSAGNLLQIRQLPPEMDGHIWVFFFSS